MKIFVYLEEASVRGGIEIFAERHVAELRSQGHIVEVAGKLPDDFAKYDEIIVHKCGDVATLAKFPPGKTTYYVHDHAPICPRTYAYTPLKNNCSRSGGFWPCIICAPACRGWKAALYRVFSQGRRKAIMARFHRIVVISQFMKSRLVANGMPADHIDVRPPEIHLKPAPQNPKLETRNPKPETQNSKLETRNPEPETQNSKLETRNSKLETSIDLLFVGQLIRGKGVQLLLQALAKLKRKRTLDIVGTGNMECELKEMAKSLGLEDRVRFHGFQDNPQDWMAVAECVVVPSFWQEPFGLVAAEAVALGRKAVVFAIGGLPEACGGKGILVPPGDVDALAKVLEEV